MSIATALTALANDVDAAKAAITAKGGTAPSGTSDMADAIAAIPSGGITPSGKKLITDTSETDVTNYATAQVVDADLVASNIKKDVNILGIVGTFEGGGGGSLPSSISKIDGGSFTVASDTKCSTYEIPHSLGVTPKSFAIWTDALNGFGAESKQYNMRCVAQIFDYESSSTTIRYGLNSHCARQASGNVYQDQNAMLDADAQARFANEARIKAYITDQYYKTGITYNWIAWA